jgi:type VI secretion system protein ImpF
MNSCMPLFDRLETIHADHMRGQDTDRSRLLHSLEKSLVRIFSVRSRLTVSEFLDRRQQSALDYGVPDTLAFSPASGEHLKRLELVIGRAIALYEPRLMHAQVKVVSNPQNSSAVNVTIAASVAMGQQLSHVDFALLLDSDATCTQVRIASK